MKTPRISVVIPTKNRSQYVNLALQSLLSQSFSDFEVLVSDNDDTQQTRKVVESISDPRLRYFRTGGLSMADNWEFGCDQARGEYVCLIEDKQAFKYRALEEVNDAIDLHQPESMRWNADLMIEYGFGHRIRPARGNGEARFVSSDTIIKTFLNGDYGDAKKILPLGHFGCIHRRLVERIKTGPLGRLCSPINPDYTMAFAQLAYCDRVLYIDKGLAVFSPVGESNGMSLRLKGKMAKRFIAEAGDPEQFYDRVPIKAITTSGTLFNDYLRFASVLGGRLARHQFNMANYFTQCHDGIVRSKQLGVDMADEEGEWTRALAQQDIRIQDEVKRQLKSRASHPLRRAARHLKAAVGGESIRAALKSIYRGRIRREPYWRFGNVLEYLEWESRKDSSPKTGSSPPHL